MIVGCLGVVRSHLTRVHQSNENPETFCPSGSYNAQEHVWRMPNGAYIELGQLESAADYAKYQGRSCTLVIVDEAGQFATP